MTTLKTNKFKLISVFVLMISLIMGCKVIDEIKKDLYVKITTSSDLTGVGWTSAILYGQVTDDGGKSITEKGIVYSENPMPTVNDMKVLSGTAMYKNDYTSSSGMGIIGVFLKDLTVSKKYYFRAYCVNSLGISYGEERTFTTNDYEAPIINLISSAADQNNIGCSAEIKNLSKIGGIESTGFYYSTTQGVKESDPFKVASPIIDSKSSFSVSLGSLKEGTTYYIKPFVKTSTKLFFGTEFSLKTMDSPIRAQLKSGLQVFYPFAGNAADESGNGFNGTTSGVTLTADRFNNNNSAYYFNGQNNSNIVTNYPGILGNSTRSFSFWLRRKDAIGNGNTIFSYGNLSTYGQGMNVGIGKDTGGNLIICDNGGSAAGTIFNLVDDKWHHYVIIWDKSFGSSVISIKLYIDGIYKANTWSYNPTNINTVAGSKMLIGQFDPSKNDWRTYLGSIDDIGIWNRILSDPEIQYLYQNNYRP